MSIDIISSFKKREAYIPSSFQNNISNNLQVPSNKNSRKMSMKSENNDLKSRFSVKSFNDSKVFNTSDKSSDCYVPSSPRSQCHSQITSNYTKPLNSHLSNLCNNKVSKVTCHQLQGNRPDLNNSRFLKKNDNLYDVIIKDDCNDLNNADIITVQDNKGNCKVYVQRQCKPSHDSKPRFKIRPVTELCDLKKNKHELSYIKDENIRCSEPNLIKYVMCHESNSMDSLLYLLNKKFQESEGNQSMKLSLRAEHVIRKHECEENHAYSGIQDGGLAISSEMQAKWENCNYNSNYYNLSNNKDHFTLPSTKPSQNCFDFFENKAQSTNTSSLNNPNVLSKIDFSNEQFYNICDKCIQTERFLFFETDNERLIISSNPCELTNAKLRKPLPVHLNCEESLLNTHDVPKTVSFKGSGRSPYLNEDNNGLMKYIPAANYSKNKKVQLSPVKHAQVQPSEVSIDEYKVPITEKPMKSVGNTFKTSKSLKNNYCENSNFEPQRYSLEMGCDAIDNQSSLATQVTHDFVESSLRDYQPKYINANSHIPMNFKGYQRDYSSSGSMFIDKERSFTQDHLSNESNALKPIFIFQPQFFPNKVYHLKDNHEICSNNHNLKTKISLPNYHELKRVIESKDLNYKAINKEGLCNHFIGHLNTLHNNNNKLNDDCFYGFKNNFPKRKYKLNNNIHTNISSKLDSLYVRKPKNCECQHNHTISHIPSVSLFNYTKQHSLQNKFCLSSQKNVKVSLKQDKERNLLENANFLDTEEIKKYPCLTKILNKFNSKSFYKEYNNIIESMEKLKKDKFANIKTNIQRNGHSNKYHNKEKKDKVKTTSAFNIYEDRVSWSQILPYLEPIINNNNVTPSFENYFSS